MPPKASPSLAASPTGTLEEARERFLTEVAVACAVLGGLACAIVTWRLLALAPQTGASMVQVLAGFVPGFDKLAKLAGVAVTGRLVAPIVAFLGGGWLTWKARGLVRWSADSLFPPFDTDLLRPIRKPGALDPLWLPPSGTDQGMRPLPWVAPPRDSPRHAVWAALIALLSDDVGEGRFDLLGYPSAPFVRFRWAMLTGRPGAGKTRMATEIARARGRRELLGRNDVETRAERRRLARGASFRTAWPFARRREAAVPGARDDAPWHDADPWDAGWVVAASERGGLLRRQNSRFDDGSLARLKAWRPRRPTVLVLDDPRPGDASRVINALLDGARRYRHPVRLIVVSQTLPQDLGLKLQLDGSWSAGPRAFIGSVLALDAAAPLSAGEVRRMFGALRLSGHLSGWKPTDDNVRRLLLRSWGNALLVCLALQRIQRRHDAEIASADELLLDRAQRIVEALEAAGLGAAEQLRAIAWATLAGGPASAFDLTAEPSPGDWPRFEPETLDAVPNLGAVWPAPAPPLVQPEPIGDAFVRLVLRRSDAATRRRVIAAAWRANPPAMLAAVRRLGQGGDALAATLRSGPPPEAALDPLDMA